jgi:hypothetical protein
MLVAQGSGVVSVKAFLRRIIMEDTQYYEIARKHGIPLEAAMLIRDDVEKEIGEVIDKLGLVEKYNQCCKERGKA